MSKYKKWLPLVTVALLLLVILMPFITHSEVYNYLYNQTQDTVAHAKIISEIEDGQPVVNVLYLAQLIFLIPLGIVNSVLHIPALSLEIYFMFAMLIALIAWIYFISRKLKSGWLGVIIPVLVCTSLLGLFKNGMIFSIINVYFVLIGAFYCMSQYLMYKERTWLTASMVLFACFVMLHPSGLYLVPTSLLALGLLLTLKLTHKYYSKELFIITGIVFLISLTSIPINYFHASTASAISTVGRNTGNYLDYLFSWNFGVGLMILLAITAGGLFLYREHIQIGNQLKYMLVMLGCLAGSLAGGVVIGITSYPERLMSDLAVVVAIITALLMAQLFNIPKHKADLTILKYLAYFVIGVNSLYTLGVWVGCV